MEHSSMILTALAGIFLLGIAAQWLAWRLRLPSILLLLIFGFLAGPVTGWLQPDALIGRDLLFPAVSLAVALILFEGGLSLRVAEVQQTRGVIRNLVTLGVLIGWALGTWGARVLLGFDLSSALVLGALLTVTGPTVVGPLLRHIQPTARVGSVAKWEGIAIDPVGALLAVLVFEAVRAAGPTLEWNEAAGRIVTGLLVTLGVGLIVGLGTGLMLILLLRRYWIPDYLQNPVMLMAVVVAFAVSDRFHADSGLLTVTLMGVVLANQKVVKLRHIVEFKENLRVLLISALFILLAARLEPRALISISGRGLLFLAWLVLIVRPVAVLACTAGSALNWRERAFLAWLAPRGIVAAAVASVFAFQMGPAGQELEAVTFLVIIGTVALYGLTAAPLARRLGVATPNPQGLLIVGAHPAARALAEAMQEAGLRVLLVDNDRPNIHQAKLAGLTAAYHSILSEGAVNELDLTGLGRLLAMTGNDEVNALAALHFRGVFGLEEVYQLPGEEPRSRRTGAIASELQGRPLFAPEATFHELERRLQNGWAIKRTPLTASFTLEDFRAHYGAEALPLALIGEDKTVRLFTIGDPPVPRPGQSLIALVNPAQEAA